MSAESVVSRLVVFDIVGTLTDTNAVDDECFVAAVAGVLGLDAAALDWSDAPHITDTGLLRWLSERHCGRVTDENESASVRRNFLALMASALETTPQRFGEIAGARLVFTSLETRGWNVALATGGWEESARLKLAAIGLDTDAVILASSSDADTRVEILQLAAARAWAAHGNAERVVSVGDGVWDVRAAAALGWPFVGIATGEQATRLRAAGASHVLRDLTDVQLLCAALETAAVPGHGETSG